MLHYHIGLKGKKDAHSIEWNLYVAPPPISRSHQSLLHNLILAFVWTSFVFRCGANRQRYQMRLKINGKTSSMTQERQEILEKLDFLWNTHDATWEDSFVELEAFKRIYGHCNVPSSYMESKLSRWIKRYVCVFSVQGAPVVAVSSGVPSTCFTLCD